MFQIYSWIQINGLNHYVSLLYSLPNISSGLIKTLSFSKEKKIVSRRCIPFPTTIYDADWILGNILGFPQIKGPFQAFMVQC